MGAAAAHAADDYPWAWQGQCPILPLPVIEEPAPAPVPPPEPVQPEQTGQPGQPGQAPAVELPPPPPPPPPPVLDPVSGHLYDPRGPRPTCARNVWSLNGSIGDSWGFVLRNCTSFVSWRLHERNGLTRFGNHFRGVHWGNAAGWDDVARRLGYRVDSVPAIGAVAQTDAGRVGHVAWVSDIGPGTVTVEEYNYGTPGGYGTRTVPVGDFRYLHLADVAPSPLVGSDRPVVSVPDGIGGSWAARVDDRGTLRLSAPGRPARVVGPRGAFTPVVAPALSLDHHGRPWVAATARDGRVLVGTTRGARPVVRAVGTSAPTASPALTQSRTRRPVLATVSAEGTLVTRRLTREGRWTVAARVGRPASWSTHTAPVLGNDASGRTWLVAVTSRGATYARSLERGRLVRLRGPAASTTSTPALTTAGDGTTTLHQVDATGRLGVRTLEGRGWSRSTAMAGRWSPYASPVVGEVPGGLQVAATDHTGAVVVVSTVPGRPSHRIGAARDLTRSPGVVTRRDAGLLVVARTGSRYLARPVAPEVDDLRPARPGFRP
ncbi:CHAP domain-containing protein [Nocardioides sp. STR2]|uniref:CHAP domain-containing protein n=1 Tax=Nocardioides pini TaxID=2975053 RepID=A0ABT4C8A2_9ACTN|nr:CHAP domain-containing protein [Nocardioides pini]MCY4725192.1 CHAP domain-containing protein [Nocardioides pini]